jgi:cytochrome c biogenesis protein CcmG, thiol:disulfide interchange protein DsbE
MRVPTRSAAGRVGARAALAAFGLLLAVSGCAPATTAGPGSAAAAPSSTAPPDLPVMKKAAGIADCPVSQRGVPAVDHGLPDLTVACLGGGRSVRLAGLRGRPMVVNVWAQWCPPCREEAPYLSQAAAANTSKLVFLGIDYADPKPDYAIEFAQLSGWRYPQLVDSEKALAGPLQLSAGPPQTLFVAADGTIVYRHAGPFRSADEIRRLARDHLGVQL